MCHNLEFVEDVRVGITNNADQINNKHRITCSPHLLCKINDNDTWALIGTGCQVTAISENFYVNLK